MEEILREFMDSLSHYLPVLHILSVDSPVSEPEVSEDKNTNLVSVTKAVLNSSFKNRSQNWCIYIQHPEIFSCIPSGLWRTNAEVHCIFAKDNHSPTRVKVLLNRMFPWKSPPKKNPPFPSRPSPFCLGILWDSHASIWSSTFTLIYFEKPLCS